MLILYGTAATSQNKQKSLLHDAQRICGKITGVDVSYIHFVKCRTVSSEQLLKQQDTLESRILSSLLNYGSHGTQRHPDTTGRSTFYVVPRSGTVSPWSSKATDIAHTCNLKKHIERIERGTMYTFATEGNSAIIQEELVSILHLIHDRMTQTVLMSLPDESILFQKHDPRPLRVVLLEDGERDASGSLSSANKEFGLALSTDEVNYLAQAFSSRDKAHNPTDAELFMFAQVNSEHCRHKIFNASWVINGTQQDFSLFEMIRFTEQQAAHKAVSAYSDNAAVMDGFEALQFYPEVRQHEDGTLSHSIYTCQKEQMPILVKVETHNHPTAISPFPGAATGSGGEIRDEGSVGQGSRPKAGLSGFCVSNLLIPDYIQPWETNFGQPAHVASALDIMLDGPLGSSSYNNEFGRPGLIGFFRTFAERVPARQNDKYEVKGYHKPIMIAGGLGHVRPQFAKKKKIKPGSALIVLGGPGLLIGLGGGAASSLASGSVSADLDFASVQRDNAEMQRRCQQVINTCIEQVDQNPIESIHDVGAGGLSNALPELVHDSDLGAIIEIRDILVDDSSMSPMEIWCNESQERYVLAVSIEMMKSFEWIALRERCPFSVVGHVTAEKNLLVTDRLMGKDVVDLEMSTLFGKPPRMIRHDHKVESTFIPFDSTLSSYLPYIDSMKKRLSEAVDRVLHLPTVGSKSFLITIGDRSVTGLVTRDQMVGPWQVPVADVAVTRSSYGFDCLTGEAMAMGERPIVALINPAASARMALAESLTNLSSAAINGLDSVKLSANWMADASKPGEGASLYEAVHAVAVEACPQLGVSIPVGKDSMSMSMEWKRGKEEHSVSSPLSLIISAFAPVENITSTWTPHIRTDLDTDTLLLFIDLALGKKRLGGSALSQVFKQIGSEAPDVEDFAHLHSFLMGCQKIHSNHQSLILAYHDRSDGGLFTTLAEMSFAGRAGLEIDLDVIDVSRNPVATLFNEELGVVVQVRAEDSGYIRTIFSEFGFPTEHIHTIGHVNQDRKNQELVIFSGGDILFSRSRILLQQAWSETSFRMQSLRDNADCAKKEFELISSDGDGIRYELTFQYEALQKYITRPKVAILREQGVNGHVEMAWAFNAAGFEAVDVHMTDIIEGHVTLQDFRGLAACGGFSYGDVLGAGKGWANSILWNSIARKEFAQFFSRTDVFSLAVCNGCQLFSHLRSLIPGTELWPDFTSNLSERFEARVSMVEIVSGPVTSTSVFLRDMQGSRLPVAIAHGEGRAWFHDLNQQKDILKHNLVAVRYVDWDGKPTEYYPLNPNGSPEGYTGIHTPDGRVLALMPHPERVTTLDSNSWYPPSMSSEWRGTGPWFRIFQNARKWCG